MSNRPGLARATRMTYSGMPVVIDRRLHAGETDQRDLYRVVPLTGGGSLWVHRSELRVAPAPKDVTRYVLTTYFGLGRQRWWAGPDLEWVADKGLAIVYTEEAKALSVEILDSTWEQLEDGEPVPTAQANAQEILDAVAYEISLNLSNGDYTHSVQDIAADVIGALSRQYGLDAPRVSG